MENLSTSSTPVRKFREGWGKLRRLLLCHLRPRKVEASLRERQGACRFCAECCDLLFRCPYLGPDKRCRIYASRFKPCAAFPIDGRDVRNLDCGFHFDEKAGRGGGLGLPFAPWARGEIALTGFSALAGVLAGLAIAWLDGLQGGYLISAGFLLLFALTLYFFRDPWRAVPASRADLLAPADGRVTDVREVEEPEFLGGKALRVGVFMSLLDVHVNRAPCSGKVALVRHREGSWRNVLFEEAWKRNENVLLGLECDCGSVAVRLVAGAVARRIALSPGPGTCVGRGERIGMVKFGSRAEVMVPLGGGWKPLVSPGQKVKAGVTPLFGREEAGAGDEEARA